MKNILIIILLLLGMYDYLNAQLSSNYFDAKLDKTESISLQDHWTLELEDKWVQAPLLVEDLNRDGKHEIAVQGFWEEMAYLVNSNGTFVEGWPQFVGLGNAAPISTNLDEDKDLEVLFTTFENGIHAFNYDGSYVDGWPVSLYWENSNKKLKDLLLWESPAIYDINADGKMELIVSGLPKASEEEEIPFDIVILDNTGQIFQLANPLTMNNPAAATVTIGDINNDETPEIIAIDIPGNIYIWNKYGEPLENWPSNTFADSMSRYVSPVLGDITGDGYLEIVIAKSWLDGAWITVFDYKANMLENWPKLTGSIWEPPALSDIDGDGNLDVILNCDSYNYKLYTFNYLGEEIERLSKDIGSKHSPLITDLDEDEKPDIITIAFVEDHTHFGLFAWNNNGNIISGFPFNTKTPGSSPVLGDFDNDGLIEIVFAAWNEDDEPATLYFWDLKNSFNKELTTWPTYRHDNWRTGCYNTGKIVSNLENDIGTTINNFSLSNYPNPFNPVTTIKYSIHTPAPGIPSREGNKSGVLVKLKVYDILGREIATLVNETKPPGTYEVQFEGSNLPSGVYFYRLTAGSYSQTRKMILAK